MQGCVRVGVGVGWGGVGTEKGKNGSESELYSKIALFFNQNIL